MFMYHEICNRDHPTAEACFTVWLELAPRCPKDVVVCVPRQCAQGVLLRCAQVQFALFMRK